MGKYSDAEALEDIAAMINVLTRLDSMQSLMAQLPNIEETSHWILRAVEYFFKLKDNVEDVQVCVRYFYALYVILGL